MNISIYGHIYNRVFTYAEDGIYHDFTVPGGAAMLGSLLGIQVSRDGGLRSEYAELGRYEDKKSGRSYYAIARRMGFRRGETLTGAVSQPDALIVWDEGFGGLSLPDGNYPLLWASGKALPDRDQFAQIAERCFVFLDADVLRASGAMISRQISWERTAADLMWQIQNNPAVSYLLKTPHILITFAEDGAVYIRRENGKLTASLVLAHGGCEGTLRDTLFGEVDDAFMLMAASLARQFPAVINDDEPLKILPILKTAGNLITAGYTIPGLQNSEYNMMDETAEPETSFLIPLSENQNGADNWCITNNVGDKRIFDIAFEYVMKGKRVIEGLPQLSFGALTTIDRWEIEAYQNIRSLIVEYAGHESTRPFSIAVFGSPGSGKSFGVTQIAKNVLPGKVEKLEFNVSQFTDLSDLGAAFQKIRDVILEGKLPLVFFDEFDSDRDGLPLGWVKSFLMPMQDGKFKDESGEHPLGKCILVFAGGTAAGFEEFVKPMNSSGADQKAFKDVKGPDFVSRLKGSINVLGPNQKDESDKNYILRRALLLRSLCEHKLPMKNGIAPISKNIVWAMLLVPKYKHGARSMESLLDMSSLSAKGIEPASLPFYSQLSIHVDADAFIKLVLRDVILSSHIEGLAKAIHADFLDNLKKDKVVKHPNMVPWEDLSEEFKESNRAQARSFAPKLNSIGYDYDAGDTPFPSVEAFDDETVILLAQNEHIRWMNEKFANGWVYAPVRDNAKKHHPLLVPWEQLPQEEKQKDINVAKNIIPMLKSIGLRVYKTI